MKMPDRHTARAVHQSAEENASRMPDGSYIPARPLPWFPARFRVFRRIKLAWFVFTGRYDALDWEGA